MSLKSVLLTSRTMDRKFLNIDELSQYLGIKKSTLYAIVERREIPFYRVGRLILFKKDEIDAFMDKCRVECVDIKKEAHNVARGLNISKVGIDKVIKNAIEGANGKGYTALHGKPDQPKGLGKEVKHGTL